MPAVEQLVGVTVSNTSAKCTIRKETAHALLVLDLKQPGIVLPPERLCGWTACEQQWRRASKTITFVIRLIHICLILQETREKVSATMSTLSLERTYHVRRGLIFGYSPQLAHRPHHSGVSVLYLHARRVPVPGCDGRDVEHRRAPRGMHGCCAGLAGVVERRGLDDAHARRDPLCFDEGIEQLFSAGGCFKGRRRDEARGQRDGLAEVL